MKFVSTLLSFIFCISISSLAMEAPDKELSNDFEKQCTLSPIISRKRANTTILGFLETYDELLEKAREKRSKSISELEQKIKLGEIIPYRIGVTMNDLNAFCQNSYIIKKNIFHRADAQGLVPVELYVLAADEKMLLEDPLVKTYTRLASILTITKTLD